MPSRSSLPSFHRRPLASHGDGPGRLRSLRGGDVEHRLGVNSITAVLMRDCLDRLGRATLAGRQHLRATRGLAVGIGTIVVMLSTVMEHVPGNFLAVTNKTTNLLTVPTALLFLFALFVPFANSPGVWVAALVAFSGVLFEMDPVTGSDPISSQLIAPFSVVAGAGVGLAACKLFSLKGVLRRVVPRRALWHVTDVRHYSTFDKGKDAS